MDRPWWLPISSSSGARPQAPRGVPQQPALRLGQPAGDAVGAGPRRPRTAGPARRAQRSSGRSAAGARPGSAGRGQQGQHIDSRGRQARSTGGSRGGATAAGSERGGDRARRSRASEPPGRRARSSVLNLVQQPGRITFDTKLDLPGRAAGLPRAQPRTSGTPTPPSAGCRTRPPATCSPWARSSLLGELLGVPDVGVAAALVGGGDAAGLRGRPASGPAAGRASEPAGAVVAGLAYMLAPRVLTTVGGAQRGDPAGRGAALDRAAARPLPARLAARRWVAFVLSAATVPLMGGQNATLVVACLVLPGLLLLLGCGAVPAPPRRPTWPPGAALVVLASLWWLVPLLLLGSYAPPFLDFIESAPTTPPGPPAGSRRCGAPATGSRSSPTAARRMGRRLRAGLLARGCWCRPCSWPALGLAGLLPAGPVAAARPRGVAPRRARGAHGRERAAGPARSSRDAWLHALDTSLAPLRNVHKFDPVVRLPLSLGLGLRS